MRRSGTLLCASLLASFAHADGMLDPAFGNGGRVTTNFGPFTGDDAAQLAVQPDGRALVAGFAQLNLEQSAMAVARYLPSGGLDTSFSGDGLLLVDFGVTSAPDFTMRAGALLIQPDGRIVLVGSVAFFPGGVHQGVARLLPDGSPDPSFGNGGSVLTPAPRDASPGISAVLLPDGRILVLGAVGPFQAQSITLALYTASGVLDPSFGTGGQTTVTLPLPFRPLRLALQADGRILVAGQAGMSGALNFGLARLLEGGSPDASFDEDGLFAPDIPGIESAADVLAYPDGRLLIAGFRNTPAIDFALVRLREGGQLDPTFGTGGLATADSGANELGQKVLLQPNGKLLLAGWTNNTGALDFILARFNDDGTHDTTFGSGGFLRTDFASGSDECRALALYGSDRLLAAGVSRGTSDFGDFALARYIASTPVEALSFSVE